jgi:hypothetical protein
MSKKLNKQQQIPIDQNPLHPEKKLVTRRDFLASGVLGFSASVMMPSMASLVLLERAARAGECPKLGAFPGTLPFIVFDCAGGAALPGNWIVTDKEGNNGQLLPSYSTLGLANLQNTRITSEFGAPMAANLIPPDIRQVQPDGSTIILPGVPNANDFASDVHIALTTDAQLSPALRAKLRMGIICHTSLSDSQANATSPVALISAAGLVGNRIKSALGNRNSPSGGNSTAAALNPGNKAMFVGSVTSLSNALSFGPAYADQPVGVKDSLVKAVLRLNDSQLTKLANKTLGPDLASLLGCNMDFSEYTTTTNSVDARDDAAVAAIYGITPATLATNALAIEATLVKNAIEGVSGSAVITIGGCDYHDGTRTTGQGRDARLGVSIANAIRVAAAKGKKFAFCIITDGGISSDSNQRTWRGDDNDHGLSVVGVWDPNAPNEMVSKQIGQYTTGQGADRNHFVGSDPKRVAHTIFLNYLALSGMLGRYQEIVTPIGVTDLIPYKLIDQLLLYPNRNV